MSYLAPVGVATAELREKGSRFLARLEPAVSEEAARERIAALAREHADATHCCWAYRLGWPARERSADAGEPLGTAGPPILRALQTAAISDALLVVLRWFGGTKLGKGGLVRAYGGVARAAVAAAALEPRLHRLILEIEVAYPQLGAVQRLLQPPEVELLEQRFGERVVLRLAVAVSRLAAVRERAAELGAVLRES